MSNVDALIGASPRILHMGDNIYGQWVIEFEYDLPRANEGEIPCTVEITLSLEEVNEWCKRLGL